jgi:hypothetical protein
MLFFHSPDELQLLDTKSIVTEAEVPLKTVGERRTSVIVGYWRDK